MAEEERVEYLLMLTGVRVCFPALFERPIIAGDEGNWGAKLLLDPAKPEDVAQIKAVLTLMKHAAQDSGKFEKMPPQDKRCLRDGNELARAEYKDMYVVGASNDKGPPFVFNKKRQLVEDSTKNPIYSGCYADAQIQIWIQDNSYGKRINASLRGIGFVADGESFDGSFIPYDDVAQAFGATGTVTDASDMGFGGDENDFDDDIPF